MMNSDSFNTFVINSIPVIKIAIGPKSSLILLYSKSSSIPRNKAPCICCHFGSILIFLNFMKFHFRLIFLEWHNQWFSSFKNMDIYCFITIAERLFVFYWINLVFYQISVLKQLICSKWSVNLYQYHTVLNISFSTILKK